MKTKQNWLVWFIFYGALAGIYFLARGDEYAPAAFRGILWFRIATVGLVCYAMHDPNRILVASPRSKPFGAAILICETFVWLAMWQMGLITELICTLLALAVYEDFRREARIANS